MPSVVTLKAGYISPRALVNEYTRSIGKGSVVVPSPRSLEVGTRIVFEMTAIGLPAPVPVRGEVVQVQENPTGGFLVAVRYLPDEVSRNGVRDAAARLIALQQFEQQRSTPRIPVNLPAWIQPSGDRATVADMSLGGMRVVFPALPRLPVGFEKGSNMEVALRSDAPSASATVAWCRTPPVGASGVPAAAGLRFASLPPSTTQVIERLLSLDDFGPGPKPITLFVKT
jgi:Tfp pilus assembly protein PilZ